MKRTLSIDIETYSPVNLKDCGLYRYVSDPDFTILLFAYAFDDEPVQCIDLTNGLFNTEPDLIPVEVLMALTDPEVLKTAHNAPFEITCIQAYLDNTLNTDDMRQMLCEEIVLTEAQWECTSVKSANAGLPMSLDGVAKALQLDQQKMKEGKALINYFCVPCKPTKANGGRIRNLPHHAPEKWSLFKEYCVQDVETERAIRQRISFIPFSAAEHELWQLDQKINKTGVLCDPVLVNNAIKIDTDHKTILTEEAIRLTGLDNVNSPAQIKVWLSEELGEDVGSLNKKAMPALLKQAAGSNAERMLELRQEMSKTSVKKYFAMQNCMGWDSRIRGLFQFCGAGRTRRWAGRLVQVQNLPRNEMANLDIARDLVYAGDGEGLAMCFNNIPGVLSELIRTSFIAPEGSRFIVADFSAIEARVLAWLAGESWRMEVFKTHGKIYEASASQMFKVPLDSISYKKDGETIKGPNYHMRAKGKVSELALGYQGGPGALINMGALAMGVCDEAIRLGKIEVAENRKALEDGDISIEYALLNGLYLEWNQAAEDFYVMKELAKLTKMWRNENKKIVKFWYDLQDAALEAILDPGTLHRVQHGISFQVKNDVLFLTLPSGGQLSYWQPRAHEEMVKGQMRWKITYMGLDQVKKIWRKIDTYGGKFCENITQAVARDCLAVALLRLDAAGYKIVMHIHDEVVIEAPEKGEGIDFKMKTVNSIMSRPIDWAPGLLLTADSYETYYYKKD